MRELLLDLFLPETDRGAIVQVVLAAVFWSVMLMAARPWRREYQLFTLGLAVITFAWFGARAIH